MRWSVNIAVLCAGYLWKVAMLSASHRLLVKYYYCSCGLLGDKHIHKTHS